MKTIALIIGIPVAILILIFLAARWYYFEVILPVDKEMKDYQDAPIFFDCESEEK